jgi:hypothetical protein
VRVSRDKSEARNPKSETNSNDQNSKKANGKKRMSDEGFEHLKFEF